MINIRLFSDQPAIVTKSSMRQRLNLIGRGEERRERRQKGEQNAFWREKKIPASSGRLFSTQAVLQKALSKCKQHRMVEDL